MRRVVKGIEPLHPSTGSHAGHGAPYLSDCGPDGLHYLKGAPGTTCEEFKQAILDALVVSG